MPEPRRVSSERAREFLVGSSEHLAELSKVGATDAHVLAMRDLAHTVLALTAELEQGRELVEAARAYREASEKAQRVSEAVSFAYHYGSTQDWTAAQAVADGQDRVLSETWHGLRNAALNLKEPAHE